MNEGGRKHYIFSSAEEAYTSLNNPKDPEGQKLAFEYLRDVEKVLVGRVGQPRETYMDTADYPDAAEGVKAYMEKYYDEPSEDDPFIESEAEVARKMGMN